MPLFLQHTDEVCQWGIWKTDETSQELLALLPQGERHRQEIQRFSAEHRRVEWLAVRVLLYSLLGREEAIAYRKTGSPYLADASVSISISHTKGYAAVILGPAGKVVGIDIEQYGERVRRVASKFMRADEMPQTYACTETWSLLVHWSAKETMFKCLDVPAVDFRKHLYIEPFLLHEQGCFNAHEYKTGQKRIFRIRYLLHSDFVLTWQAD